MKKNKTKKYNCTIPINPKAVSRRCQPKGATKPVTYTVKHEGKVVRDEKGEVVTETIQVPMNRKERRSNTTSYKTWKKMEMMERAVRLMNHKMEQAKEKKEAKAIKKGKEVLKAEQAKKDKKIVIENKEDNVTNA